jgi:hypothetical protein
MASYATIGAALIRFNGSAISSGPDAGVFEQVAKALSTLAVLDAIGAWAEAVGPALDDIGTTISAPPYSNVTLAPLLITMNTALTALTAAVTAAAAAVPSQSTGAT